MSYNVKVITVSIVAAFVFYRTTIITWGSQSDGEDHKGPDYGHHHLKDLGERPQRRQWRLALRSFLGHSRTPGALWMTAASSSHRRSTPVQDMQARTEYSASLLVFSYVWIRIRNCDYKIENAIVQIIVTCHMIT